MAVAPRRPMPTGRTPPRSSRVRPVRERSYRPSPRRGAGSLPLLAAASLLAILPSASAAVVGHLAPVPSAGSASFLGASPDRRGPAGATTAWDPSTGRSSPGVGPDRLTTIPLLPAHPAGFLSSPAWLAYDPNDHEMFVAAPPSSVDVVNWTGPGYSYTIDAIIAVGSSPFGVAVDAGHHHVFVTNTGSDNVSVIDDRTLAVVASVPVGYQPYGIAYDALSDMAFVADQGSNNVTVVNGTLLASVNSIGVGSAPLGVAFDPYSGHLFVANGGSNNVSVVDATQTVIASVPAGTGPYGVAVDNETDQIFVTNQGSYNISVLDGVHHRLVTTIPVLSPFLQLQGIGFDPKTHTMWVGAGSFYAVAVNATSLQVAGFFTTDPSGVAYDPYTGDVCLTNTGNFTLVCISATMMNTSTVRFNAVGLPTGLPWGVRIGQAGSHNTTVESNGSRSTLDVALFFWGGVNQQDYQYWIISPTGYVPSAASGSILYGSPIPTDVNITFSGGTGSYRVEFNESGLPFGTNWSVRFYGTNLSSNTNALSVYAPNGSYVYSIPAVGNLTPSPSAGTVVVSGSWVFVPVLFSGPNFSISPVVSPAPADVNALVTFSSNLVANGVSAYPESWIIETSGPCASPPCYTSTTGPTVSMYYSAVGNYSAQLWVNDTAGTRLYASLPVPIVPGPKATLTATAATGPGTTNRSWDFSTNVTLGVAPYYARWWFSDGSSANGTAVSHTFNGTGNETASLYVTDAGGGNATGYWIHVVGGSSGGGSGGGPLKVSASADWSAGAAPFWDNFTSTRTGGTAPYAFSWSFGDGGNASAANASHEFATPGVYNATVTVVDARAASASAYWWVYVSASSSGAPVVTMTAVPAQVLVGERSRVTTTVTGGTGGYALEWTGDLAGCTALPHLGQECAYTTIGDRSIALSVTDARGRTGTGSVVISTVAQLPGGGAPGLWSQLATPLGLGVLSATVAAVVIASLLLARRGRPPESGEELSPGPGASRSPGSYRPEGGPAEAPARTNPPEPDAAARRNGTVAPDPMSDFL